ACCDVFVVMDDLQFEAQNFQNRNRVKINNGAIWLTVPLVKGAQCDRICDKQIAEPPNRREDWRRRAWVTLYTHYHKAPYFALYSAAVCEMFERQWRSLVEFDLHVLRTLMGWFGIATPVHLASTLALSGHKTERILHMCKSLGATTYLSGR